MHLAVLGLLAALKAASLVGIALAVSSGIVAVIAGDDYQGALTLGLASGVLRAAVTWAQGSYATRAALGAKQQLRGELAASLLEGGDVSAGSATAVATVGLDELDNYYRTALPAVITAAVVPLLVGLAILAADPISALIVVITVPLVPVFMALVGMHTKDRADAASAALQRLSDHLVELARGLPVLVGLGRIEEQSAALRAVSDRHRVATMATLRTAFLSSLVLELISTISVAVVAVFVGVRLVYGELPLVVGLVALVLAPECFAPFRELGAAFHSSQNGLAAMRRARAIIDGAQPIEPGESQLPGLVNLGPPTGGLVRLDPPELDPRIAVRARDITITYPDRSTPAVAGFSFDIAVGSITSIEGASGAGKSSVLGALAGLVPLSGGELTTVPADAVAWVPQHPHTIAGTVWQEVRLYADSDQATDAALDRLGLTPLAAADPARVSPGELRRIAVARGLVRVDAGATLLLLDEPTAHLDLTSAHLVERALEALRGRVTVVIASHEASVSSLADHRVRLPLQGGLRSESSLADGLDASPAVARVEPDETPDTVVSPSRASGSVAAELRAFLTWRYLPAILLGSAASLAALALTAVSGWLIVRASEEPSFMYLMVAIVGVRFFGVARAGLRYAERLVTHDAVLGSLTDLRQRLWTGLAARGPASRVLASGGAALDYIVGAADIVRDLVPRVILPPAVAIVTAVAAVIATAALHPAAVPVLLAGLVVSIVIAPVVALAADRHAARGIAAVRSTVMREFSAMVSASGELRANGVGPRVLARLAAADARAARLASSTAWALGLGNAVIVLACVTTAVVIMPATSAAVAAGTLPAAVVAVLVLIPLGLIEPLTALVDAVQQWFALSRALARVHAVAAPLSSRGGRAIDRIERIELDSVKAGWPGSEPFGPVTATATAGDWIVVEGPSGAGKSTLLATLLGYLAPASGTVLINDADASTIDPTSLRSHIAWCPQESHIFDSTIRGNLLLARDHDDAPSDFELEAVLIRVGLGPLLDRLDDGLDARVGSAGDQLSGGERQRLAVARTLLTRADLVLLDEPTAHLDEAAAEQLMLDLRFALRERIVVLVSHHTSERLEGDSLIRFEETLSAPSLANR